MKTKMVLTFELSAVQAIRLLPLVEELLDVVNNKLGNPDDNAWAIVRIKNKINRTISTDESTIHKLVNLVKRGFGSRVISELHKIVNNE